MGLHRQGLDLHGLRGSGFLRKYFSGSPVGDPLLSFRNSQRFDKDTTGSLRLSVDIHPGHVRFSVTLNHAQKFPAVALIETGMVGDQIGRGNALGAQILHGHVQKISGNALAAVAFLGVDRADIGVTSIWLVFLYFTITGYSSRPREWRSCTTFSAAGCFTACMP